MIPPSIDDPVGCVFDCLLDVVLVEDRGPVPCFRVELGEPSGKFFPAQILDQGL